MRLVIPAAGLGTRMNAITFGAPKELLELGGRTILEHIVQEAQEAGIREVTLVWSREKPDILEFCERFDMDLSFQIPKRGLAAAIASGIKDYDEKIAVSLADVVYWPISPIKLLMAETEADFVIAIEKVSDENVKNYGIVELSSTGRIEKILEKPEPQETHSRMAVASRYMFGPKFVQLLSRMVLGQQENAPEMSLEPVFAAAIAMGLHGKAIELESNMRRYDCGSPAGYEAAKGAFA